MTDVIYGGTEYWDLTVVLEGTSGGHDILGNIALIGGIEPVLTGLIDDVGIGPSVSIEAPAMQELLEPYTLNDDDG